MVSMDSGMVSIDSGDGEHGSVEHDHTHPHADPEPPSDGPDLTLEVSR